MNSAVARRSIETESNMETDTEMKNNPAPEAQHAPAAENAESAPKEGLLEEIVSEGSAAPDTGLGDEVLAFEDELPEFDLDFDLEELAEQSAEAAASGKEKYAEAVPEEHEPVPGGTAFFPAVRKQAKPDGATGVFRAVRKDNRNTPSEYFDGSLSREEEDKLFSSQNPSAIPRPIEELRANTARADDSTEQQAAEATEKEAKAERKARFRKTMRILWKIWAVIRIPIIIAATLFIVYFVGKKVVTKLYNGYLMPVDPNDSTPIVVDIPAGSGASAVAKILYEACGEGETGLIAHKAVFKVYVDFMGKSSRLQAGTYVLCKSMSIPDIVDSLCRGVPPRETFKLQIVEGMTIEGMAAKLVDDGIIESPDHFLELCRTGEAFAESYAFIKDIPEDPTGERKYALEGFLFPDTYEFYVGATEENIIEKLLSRFNQIFGPIYTARANELGMSVYEVVTLASTIEKEARLNADFAKVSAVFYNRMAMDVPLESDATLEYVLQTGKLDLTDEQLNTPSGYNTHLNKGLPLGPVSNPGDTALRAALYPNEEFEAEGYLFFCLMNPETGALIYAKTLEEHNANVAKYKPLW